MTRTPINPPKPRGRQPKKPRPEPTTDTQREILKHNGKSQGEVARIVGCHQTLVSQTRKRFAHLAYKPTTSARSRKDILKLIREKLKHI